MDRRRPIHPQLRLNLKRGRLIRVATAARPVQVRARPVRRVPLGRQAGIDPERRPVLSQPPSSTARSSTSLAAPTERHRALQGNSRGGGGVRTLNVPNWDGTTNKVEILLERLREPELLARPMGPRGGRPARMRRQGRRPARDFLRQAALSVWLQPPRPSATPIALRTERVVEHEVTDLAAERLTCTLVVAEVLPGEDAARGRLV